MIQRIRYAIQHQDFGKPLEGICTADESYVGGKQKNKHYDKKMRGQQGRGSSEKINVFGVMEVGGRVKSVAVPDVKRETLVPLILEYVKPGSTMMTDEWSAYSHLHLDYFHLKCDHGRHQYVSDEGATTNPIENYWSHLKRTIHGTYHWVSRKHIPKYLAEFDFRFNTRKETDSVRFNIALSQMQGRLKYKELTQKP